MEHALRHGGGLRFRLRAPRFGALQARRSSRSEQRRVERDDFYPNVFGMNATAGPFIYRSLAKPKRNTAGLRPRQRIYYHVVRRAKR